MKEKNNYFELLSGQRYYHVVAFEVNGNLYSLQAFWKDCGVLKRNNIISNDMFNAVVEQGKLITEMQYHFGDEDFSIEGNNKAPFQYDIFAVLIKKFNILIFGFPFKAMARVFLEKMIDQKKILSKGNFVKPDLDKLIKQNNKGSQFSNDFFTTHFSGVELTLTGETNISSVNLDGDRPLESNLYKNVFLQKVESNQCKLEKCSLKCETFGNEPDNIPKSKSNIHLDLYGNYKLYVHGSGKNLFTIPFLFELLAKSKCLKPSLINPIQKLNDGV